ncbi:unnamed protein product [Merluccius merluccius]
MQLHKNQKSCRVLSSAPLRRARRCSSGPRRSDVNHETTGDFDSVDTELPPLVYRTPRLAFPVERLEQDVRRGTSQG